MSALTSRPESPRSPTVTDELQAVLLALIEVQPLPDVLQRLADSALRVTNADYAALGVYSEHGMESFTWSGMSAQAAARMPHPPLGRGLIGRFRDEPRTIALEVLQEHPVSSGWPEGHPPMSAFVGVPVMYGGEVIGAFYVTRKPGREPFTPEETAALETMAPYAAVAMSNARILDEVRSERVRLRTLVEASPVGVVIVDREGEVQLINHEAERILGVRGRGRFFDWYGRDFVYRRPDGAVYDTSELPLRRALDRHERTRGEHVLVEAGERTLHVLVDALPIPIDDTQHAGVLIVLQDITGMVEEREAEAELERYRLRDEIARDLHDDVIQSVYAVGLSLRAARVLDTVTKDQALEQAAHDLNSVIADLRSYIEQLSLPPGARPPEAMLARRLRSLVGQDDEAGPQWQLDVEIAEELPPQVERQVYLIVRELVSNVERHAEARRASVSLRLEADELSIEVRDDGSGFDPSRIRAGAIGLQSVQQRFAMLGGDAVVETQPGAGTTVRGSVRVRDGVES